MSCTEVFHAAGVNYNNTRFYKDNDNLQVIFSDEAFNQIGSMTIASYGNQKVAEGLLIYDNDNVPLLGGNYVGGFIGFTVILMGWRITEGYQMQTEI